MSPRQKFDRYMVALGVGTHPKLARLTDAEWRAHIGGVLAVAAMSQIRGRLLVGDLPAEPIDIASAAGVSEKVAESAMRKLLAVGVLLGDDEYGCLRVHDWDDVNPPPKTDNTAAERQQRRRDALRRDGNGHAPVTPIVTPPSRRDSPLDSVTVTPTEGEVEVEEPTSLRSVAPAAVPPGPSEDTVERLCQSMSTLVRVTHGVDADSKVGLVTKGWRDACRSMLIAGWTERQIAFAFDWVCTHHYWSRRIRSMPRLKSEMKQVVKEIKEQHDRGGQVVAINRKPSASDMLRVINGDAA